MNYNIEKNHITAMQNLIKIAHEHYDSRQVVCTDDVIALQSAQLLNKIVEHAHETWYSDDSESMIDQLDHSNKEHVEYLLDRDERSSL